MKKRLISWKTPLTKNLTLGEVYTFNSNNLFYDNIGESRDSERGVWEEVEPKASKDVGKHYRATYTRVLTLEDIKAGEVTLQLDPFRISQVYGNLSAAQLTALKKVLVTGNRGKKSVIEDWDDIIGAAERAKEMLLEDEHVKSNT